MQAEITRHDEIVVNCKEHKEFLDKLASKEWHEMKQKKRKEIIAKAKELFIQKELQSYDEDDNESQNTFLQMKAGLKQEKRQAKNRPIASLRENGEEKFNQLLKDGEM